MAIAQMNWGRLRFVLEDKRMEEFAESLNNVYSLAENHPGFIWRIPDSQSISQLSDLGFDKSVIRARRHPNNVWSLHGLAECLKRQNKRNELKLIEQSLEFATGRIDISIKASCY